MRIIQWLFIVISSALLAACAMVTSWKAIPPPGGCDQCHTKQISADWNVGYQVANLSDERGNVYFQTEAGSFPQKDKAQSSLSIQKGEDQACFNCHRAPTPVHKTRKGRYHH